MRKNARTRDDSSVKRDSFLGTQRKKLEELREHLVRRTDKVDRDLSREGGLEPDFAEQAVTRANDDVLSVLNQEGRDQLALVDAALARLDAGSYGSCGTCGGVVARARLKALPYAATCAPCAEKAG